MKQKSSTLEISKEEAFERALAFAKKSLKVNPDAFEHYVREGVKKAPELRFHSDKGLNSPYFPLVQIIHGLFSASNFSQGLNNLRVVEIVGDSSSFYNYEFHTIGISVVGSKKTILGHLLHEYTHVAEFSDIFTRLYYGITLFQLSHYQADDLMALLNTEILKYYNSSKELSLFPVWLWRYNKLLYSFVSAEGTSTAVEIAFTNPELLRAFYQIRGLTEDPLNSIEKKFGWEGIFPELDKELINLYKGELEEIKKLLQKEILPRIKRKAILGFFVPRDSDLFSVRQIKDFSLFKGWHFYP